MARVRDYLSLCRFPAVFTALADPLVGWTLTTAARPPAALAAWLMLASAGLYLFGMVLNDLHDRAEDALTRPDRVLPSGRLSAAQAGRFAVALVLLGTVSAGLCGAIPGSRARVPQMALAAAALLTLIVAYTLIKDRPALALLGVVLMGSCRAANVMMGAVAAGATRDDLPALWPVAAIAAYVAGLTLFSAGAPEPPTSPGRRSWLTGGLLLCIAALLTLMMLPFTRRPPLAGAAPFTAAMSFVPLLVFVGLAGPRAMREGTPARIGPTVGRLVLLLIPLDAALLLATTGDVVLAALTLGLLPVALLFRRIRID